MKKFILVLLFTFWAVSAAYCNVDTVEPIVEYDQFKNIVVVSVHRENPLPNKDGTLHMVCDRIFELNKYDYYKKKKSSYESAPATLTFIAVCTDRPYFIGKSLEYVIGNNPGNSLVITRLRDNFDKGFISTSGICTLRENSDIYKAIVSNQAPIMRLNFTNKPGFVFTLSDDTMLAFQKVFEYDIVAETEKRIQELENKKE